ncbi:Asp-tRNA(Asn)/Glu-tRNA(Gln) amidotransferase subunit GatC [soil metagenome]
MSTETPSSISTSANSRPSTSGSPGEITTEQVAHLASLARIRLTPDEITKLTGELVTIVDNVAKVTEVATPDVPATSHPIPLQNVYRPDVVGVTLTQEQALSGAPDHDGSRFRVSAILGEEQ